MDARGKDAVIRLVSQFDAPRARAQVASPKSSACSCCCCCCVATALTSSILTARAIGRVPPSDELLRNPPEPIAAAPTTPVGVDAATAAEPPVPQLKRANPSTTGWKVFGFFLLGLCIALSSAVAMTMRNQAAVAAWVVTFFGSYLGGLLALRRWVGLHGGWIVALVVALPFAIALEVAIWIGVILK
jgi:hypothetical protein